MARIAMAHIAMAMRASLSHFQEVYFNNWQEAKVQQIEWGNSRSDVCIGQPGRTVSSHFFLVSVGQSLLAF